MSFKTIHKTRRAITALILSGAVILTIIVNPNAWQKKSRIKRERSNEYWFGRKGRYR